MKSNPHCPGWKPQLLVVCICAVIFSCNSPKPSTPAQIVNFDSLTNEYYEDVARLYPLYATLLGDHQYNDILQNDVTQAYRDEFSTLCKKYQEKLALINPDSLSVEDKINYDILIYENKLGLEGLKYKAHLIPLNQYWSLNNFVGILASGESGQPFATPKDYDNWLKRLKSFQVWSDSAIANMRKGIKEGIVLPEVLALKVTPQLEAFSKGPVESHLYYKPVLKIPETFSAEEKKRITGRYSKMVADTIIPTFEKLRTFLHDEYLPNTRKTHGLSALPGGKEWYQFLIRYYTTTNKTADEIFELGEQEVTRIENEMEKIKEKIGYKGSLKDFFNEVRQSKKLMPFTKPEEVLNNFQKIHVKMQPKLKLLFKTEPKTAFEIKRTEAFREKSASAQYFPGSPDGSRPGTFYVPIPEVKEYNILQDETLFLHEAIPGHHYQIALQMENMNIPKFRNLVSYTAYVEGWALYAESLGKELGLYTDPYQHFGNLSSEMHRAIRLVVDAGIHAKGWTREQAIQYSLDHEAEPEASVISEVERYMAVPGQALAYKVGELKILELRKKAEASLGNNFNIADFHEQVLESGSVPLSVLENKIDSWIASKQ